MGETAVIPAWVVQPPTQVADCHRIAHATAAQTGRVRMAAVAATVNWVTGGQPAPLTERLDVPTAAVARAEMMLAIGPLHAELWRELGVEPREPVTNHPEWLEGVALALGWLLGIHSRPPLRLPRRNPDGTTPTADQLYREALEARPHTAPEQRNAARDEAAALAGRYRRLAELADSAG
jgi:hypothetical protein